MTTLSHYLPPPFSADACYYYVDNQNPHKHEMAPPHRPAPPIPAHALEIRPSSTSSSTSPYTSSASSTRSLSPPIFVEHLSPAQIQALALTARRKQTQFHHKLSHILGDAMLLDVLELELQAERRRSYTRPKPTSDERGRPEQRAAMVVTSVTEVEADEDD